MAKHAYHDHLTKVPLFADLTDDELDDVARATTQLDYSEGKVLMSQGGVAHELFVVVEGTLEVSRDGEHIAELGPGDFAGEMAVLARGHRNSTVTATSDVSVLHIDGRAFASVLHDVPAIAAKMLPVVADRLRDNADDHSY